MPIIRIVIGRFGGDDVKMRRLVTYWGATVLLYLLSIVIVWVEVFDGAAQRQPVFWLTALAVAGHALFYVLIRNWQRWNLTPAQLSVYQGRFAIFCTVAGYSVMGPLRGASLVILLVILVFCAFTLEAKKTHSLSIFALILLGVAMALMRYTAPNQFDAKTELIHFTLCGSMLIVVAILTGRMSELRSKLKAQKSELEGALAHIRMLATHDELTALPNRRYMGDLLHAEERRRESDGSSACLALLDIDWFKKINDVYGHDAGDEVLRRFGQESRLILRTGDVLARWGGEEFLLYLPNTRLDESNVIIDRLSEQVRAMSFQHGEGEFGITFSGGLVELLPGDPVAAAITRADALLYQAKAEGRNRVVAGGMPLQTRNNASFA
ncbi:GGDEF domain-containing protein [Herbaspirillum sp. HC18]|nr:GGDEF domain-containing protein [Herbaspirillum sp. HC18]